MTSGDINIKGIPKTAILFDLWTNSKPASFFIISRISPPDFNWEEAETAVLTYIDYFCGRLIKSDISKSITSDIGYNREYGDNTYETIILALREKYNEC